MLDKLNIVQQRFNEISDLIIQPDIITDQKRYIKLNKEYKEFGIIVEKKKLYEDNDERAIFFAKGVVETIKKLNWTPDIIHVHGWIASLMPLYLKQYYKDEPLFSKSKVVTSIYENEITGDLNSGIINKIKFDEVESDTLNVLENPTYENLYKLSIMNSDGVVFASENIKKSFLDVAMNSKITVLKCGFKEGFEKEYMDFYNDKILN